MTNATPEQDAPQPIRDYEWAVDALLEALAYLNKGEPEKAHLSIRTALWHPDHHPKLTD